MTPGKKRSQQDRQRRLYAARLPGEPVDKKTVWLRDNGICHLCGIAADPLDWHADHVIPAALGGPHWIVDQSTNFLVSGEWGLDLNELAGYLTPKQ